MNIKQIITEINICVHIDQSFIMGDLTQQERVGNMGAWSGKTS